jgi:AcrR family transcriptional regulator
VSNGNASAAAARGRPAGRPVTIDRQRFISAALAMLARGANLAEVSVDALCASAGAGKGSFYSPGHFRDGKLPELHQEVINAWLRERAAAADVLGATLLTVRDPLKRLRMIRAAGCLDATRADAMRRWAVTSGMAARAVAEAARPVLAHISAAFGDLGFPGADADALAGLLAPALSSGDDAAVEVLLMTLERAARDLRSEDEVAAAPGRGPGETVLFMLPRGTPPEVRAQVEKEAQGWLVSLVSLVPGEPGGSAQLAQAAQPGDGGELRRLPARGCRAGAPSGDDPAGG